MIRQTGGFAKGATSTRSRSCCWAMASASARGVIPSWRPSASTSRTSRARIRSLIRGSLELGTVVIGRRPLARAEAVLDRTKGKPAMPTGHSKTRRTHRQRRQWPGGSHAIRAAPLPSVVTTYASSMSSLWTPEGEHHVPRQGEAGSGTGGSPGAEGPGGRGAPGAPRAEPGMMTEEELAAEEELLEVAKHLAGVPAEDVVANHCYGLFELAALHLSPQPPQPDKARLAIDALGLLVDGLGERLGQQDRK